MADSQHIQSFCITLPGTTEDIKWDDHLCFCVAEKMYAVLTFHEDGSPRISLKTTPDLFQVLTLREHIIPAPYMARYHWIKIEDLTALEEGELERLIEDSYHLIFNKLSKKVRTAIGDR